MILLNHLRGYSSYLSSFSSALFRGQLASSPLFCRFCSQAALIVCRPFAGVVRHLPLYVIVLGFHAARTTETAVSVGLAFSSFGLTGVSFDAPVFAAALNLYDSSRCRSTSLMHHLMPQTSLFRPVPSARVLPAAPCPSLSPTSRRFPASFHCSGVSNDAPFHRSLPFKLVPDVSALELPVFRSYLHPSTSKGVVLAFGDLRRPG